MKRASGMDTSWKLSQKGYLKYYSSFHNEQTSYQIRRLPSFHFHSHKIAGEHCVKKRENKLQKD